MKTYFKFGDGFCRQVDVKLVQNLRSHNATLAVGDHDNFFHIWIRAIGFDILITHSGLLGEKIERALKNTLEEIAEHSVSSVVDSENRTPKGFSQHVNILLDVVSRNTTSIKEEPAFSSNSLVLCDDFRIGRCFGPDFRRALHGEANDMKEGLTDRETKNSYWPGKKEEQWNDGDQKDDFENAGER